MLPISLNFKIPSVNYKVNKKTPVQQYLRIIKIKRTAFPSYTSTLATSPVAGKGVDCELLQWGKCTNGWTFCRDPYR